MESPQQILEAVNGYQASRVILSAIELRIFSILKTKMMTSAEIAEEAGTEERATDRLMNSLCALELLRKKNGKFYNTPVASQYLVESSDDFMAGLMHTNHLWDSWSTLSECVKKGTKVYKSSTNNHWTKAFIQAMHFRGKDQAKILKYMIDFSSVSKFLDLGGGSGAFSVEFAGMKEDIRGFLLDLPAVLPITEEFVKKEKVAEKISLLEGNYLKDDIGSGYDMIFFSAVIHSNSYDENKMLMGKCFKALNKGGEVIIVDYIMQEDRILPARGAFFALNMLVNTTAGDTYTFDEINEWFTSAGFGSVKKKDTGFGSSMVIGKKR